MRVCILGGRGTVGGLLTKRLQTKYTVTSVTRDQVDLFNTESVDQFFANNAFDIVINCAINPYSHLDAPIEVASNNLTLFANLYAHREKFGRVIHFCSGAEFNTRYNITDAHEASLFTSRPTDPYGLSKNFTARISFATDNIYNLRLFGVFYPTELPRRLLPSILAGKFITIKDKYFDFLYLEDLVPVVEYYIDTAVPKFKDINVVYPEKILLSDFVRKFINLNNLDIQLPVDPTLGLDYTGNSTRYLELDLPRVGQDVGLKNYII